MWPSACSAPAPFPLPDPATMSPRSLKLVGAMEVLGSLLLALAAVWILAICLLCSAQFVLYHAPNVPLMGVSFFAGLIVSRIYLSIPNLVAAAASHALIGTLLHRIVGTCMRSGPFYYDQDVHPLRTLFPFFTKQLIGDMW